MQILNPYCRKEEIIRIFYLARILTCKMTGKYWIVNSIIEHITCYKDILYMKVKSNQLLTDLQRQFHKIKCSFRKRLNLLK